MSTTPTFSQPAKQQQPASRSSSITSPASATLNLSENSDDLQTPAVPSHEYDRYKQQTGIPTGSLNGLGGFRQNSQQSDSFDQTFSFSGIGLDESSFMADADIPSNTGLGMTADPNMEWDVTPSNVDNFFKVEDESFVNPSNIEEPQQQVRFFPGMHRQQAQRKQQEMLQQRQQQMQQQAAQKQREQQARSHSSRRSTSNITDARTEETIARVVNQIRQSSSQSKDGSPSGSLLPQIVRMKKDEEDMDEDERLLASEEGKKLSSKERRQLRNKVSARAFRSRRKGSSPPTSMSRCNMLTCRRVHWPA
jgi:bZIP-type transcription factor MBZ1